MQVRDGLETPFQPDDLSWHHAPMTDLFPQPSSAAEWDAYRLTDEQLRSFDELGYVAGIQMLSDDQVDVLRTELAELSEPGCQRRELFYEYNVNESADPARVLFHALGAWRVSPAFHDLLWNPAFLMPASQLLRGPVRFWHDQLFSKPARHGGVVAWHQDYSYWTRTQPMSHLTCWIALDDATRDNGCLHYVPGSHRWDLLPKPALAGDMHAIQSVLSAEQRAQFVPVAIELRKGMATFHHPMMLHGSFENTTDRPRRAAVLNVFRDGVRAASSEPLLDGVPAIREGEEIVGRFFPRLFDPHLTA
jgi:ectoine hydroxylase-related dioxygenase (phytanoyl-CoA dioxygenase family)